MTVTTASEGGDPSPSHPHPHHDPHSIPIPTSRPPQPPRDARTPILGYIVWAGASRPFCNTSSTACSLLLPPALLDLRVTAYNARGASSPARVPLRRDPSPEGGTSSSPASAFYLNGEGRNVIVHARGFKARAEPFCQGNAVSSRQGHSPWRCPSSTAQRFASESCSNEFKNKLVLLAGHRPCSQLPK